MTALIEEIYTQFPEIERFVEDGDITEKRVLEINEELKSIGTWCPYHDDPCLICGGILECCSNETMDWEEEKRALNQWLDEQESESFGYYDHWEHNIGECKAHFYGVCHGEESGSPCKTPSIYGCSYKKD